MAIQFLAGQVLVSDPAPTGPTVLTGPVKDLQVKVVRLTSANFLAAGVNTLVAVLPADASIISIRTWVGTALAGNTVSAPLLSLGTASAGTQFLNALALTNTSGTAALATPVTGIFQAYQVPYAGDIQIWVRGTCTSGPPNSGEIFMAIEYVR